MTTGFMEQSPGQELTWTGLHITPGRLSQRAGEPTGPRSLPLSVPTGGRARSPAGPLLHLLLLCRVSKQHVIFTSMNGFLLLLH